MLCKVCRLAIVFLLPIAHAGAEPGAEVITPHGYETTGTTLASTQARERGPVADPQNHLVRIQQQGAHGTSSAVGVLLSSGRVLTSLSGIGSGRGLHVAFSDKSEASARVLRTHRGFDLALLLLDGDVQRSGLDLSLGGESSSVLSFRGPKATRSAFSGALAPLVFGADSVEIRGVTVSSRSWPLGTPVVDAEGRLAALCVSACVPTIGGAMSSCRERDVALPASLISKFLEGAASSDSEGWLGVRVELADSGFVRGVRVLGIEPGSPAQASNLMSAQIDSDGDLLVALNDVPIGTPTRLQLIVASQLPGTEVDLLLLRDGTFRRVTVRLGAQPRVPKPWQIDPPLIQPPSPWPGF